jgi:hypothetical protein
MTNFIHDHIKAGKIEGAKAIMAILNKLINDEVMYQNEQDYVDASAIASIGWLQSAMNIELINYIGNLHNGVTSFDEEGD